MPGLRSTPSHTARLARLALVAAMLAALVACSSTPQAPVPADRDGPGTPPPDVARIPDAEPRIEPIRSGGPNKPYEVAGREYVPIREDKPFTERGLASWYGRKFHGRRTASGEAYDMHAMTAAHPTLPLPSYVRVTNPKTGREIVVRVNDRGPFVRGRIIDLSYVAAIKLGVANGLSPVEVTRITFDEIRTGSWRRGLTPDAQAPMLAQAAEPAQPPPSPAPVMADPVVVVNEPVLLAAASGAASAPVASEPRRPIVEAPSAPARGFWVQLAAFRDRNGADGFHRKVIADLEWLGPLLAVVNEAGVFRLQAGPYASRDDAQAASQRVRDQLRLVPVIVERR